MTKTIALISVLALTAGLGAAGANAAPVHKHHASGELASSAQLSREHNRAVKAGDTANDPDNSASSDALNQQQLAKAQALPGAEVEPGAINSGATNTSGVDTNTNVAPSSTSVAPAAPSPDTNAMPPQSPPVEGTTPGTQDTPQTQPSAPQGSMPSTSPSTPQ